MIKYKVLVLETLSDLKELKGGLVVDPSTGGRGRSLRRGKEAGCQRRRGRRRRSCHRRRSRRKRCQRRRGRRRRSCHRRRSRRRRCQRRRRRGRGRRGQRLSEATQVMMEGQTGWKVSRKGFGSLDFHYLSSQLVNLFLL